jgi:hypothetical protein
MAIQNERTGNSFDLWAQPSIIDEEVGPWQRVFRERKSSKDRLRRLAERRPRGVEDESLMLMVERIAALTNRKECEVVNELLWSAVNARLKSAA